MESEKTQKKKFLLVDNAYLDSYEATKNDSELIALIFKEQQNDRVYSVELDEMEMDNYSNLKSEDKQIVQAQLLIFETVEDRITNSRGRVNRPLHKSKDNHKVCTYSSA